MRPMTSEQSHKVHLSPEDQERLRELRAQKPARNVPKLALTPGAMLADRVAETVGSWRFILIQSVILGIWIILNMIAFINHWDPYPFILLNLVLSFQAAYAAPIIMMSQNRQSEIDRRHAEHDYRINVKAELEIELLHNKIDALREQEILQLLNIIQRLSAHLAPELVAAVKAAAAAGGGRRPAFTELADRPNSVRRIGRLITLVIALIPENASRTEWRTGPWRQSTRRLAATS